MSYKIIAKVLANILKPIMPTIVGPNQKAFIKGRQIMDFFLLASEIVEHHKRKQKKVVLDFEKAFDIVK